VSRRPSYTRQDDAPSPIDPCTNAAWSRRWGFRDAKGHVTHDGETHERYPGQGLVTDDGYLFWVGVARSGSGDYTCADGHGTELDSWWIMGDPGVEI
jgi:hypothetical protein